MSKKLEDPVKWTHWGSIRKLDKQEELITFGAYLWVLHGRVYYVGIVGHNRKRNDLGSRTLWDRLNDYRASARRRAPGIKIPSKRVWNEAGDIEYQWDSSKPVGAGPSADLVEEHLEMTKLYTWTPDGISGQEKIQKLIEVEGAILTYFRGRNAPYRLSNEKGGRPSRDVRIDWPSELESRDRLPKRLPCVES